MVSGSTRQDRSTQLLHGVLDMCLMAVIREEPSYGYEMARKLSERGLGLASEGSIYPVLSRLQRSGMIEGYLVQSSEGPARKYYRITDKGRRSLDTWMDEWKHFRSAVDSVVGVDDAG
ncbi:MAG: PadR family transcriptional regulator [Acidimicrobiales bacterium]|nr:PadR family transcriptional regulator [Acidimicrobiales bacterium]